jgi:Rad3-related DNA helicase
MTVSGSIDYFKRKVGLEGDLEDRTSFKAFSSPFSREQMFRCAVQSPLLPDASGYNEYIADVVIRLLNAFDRNILVLFTANAMLYGVHNVIKNSTTFPQDGEFFVQGISGTRATLLDKFKESKKGVLLGTSSFWEGIDAPGDACEIVIIPRLPFPVPTHPLTQALAARVEEKYGDSFFGYSVPEAVIRFRQGAGRLIRTGDDRGAFIVLDGRVVSKAYGKVFINSLEGEFIKSANVDEMMEKIETFFNNN